MSMHLKHLNWLVVAGFLSLPAALPGQESEIHRDHHVQARLVGEWAHLQPGQPYRVGLLLEHDPGWHTYWKSTATGYATSIKWDLPPGFTVSGLSWPAPELYDFQGYREYVYSGQVLLMATLSPPTEIDAESVKIGFTADWLMCADVCIPGKADGELVLKVRKETPEPASPWAALFEQFQNRLPEQPEGRQLQAWYEPGKEAVLLEVEGPLPASIHFFDDQALFKANGQSEVIPGEAGFRRLRLPLDPATDSPPDRLSGVLAAVDSPESSQETALQIDLPVMSSPPDSEGMQEGLGLQLLLLAFLGGLILNLMPCVFPVLGIKIMGFVSQSGGARGRIIWHGLTFTAGVLVSFWILTAFLLVLRSGGEQLGWGFQLQSPAFVLVLSLLLFGFALNMSGLFEFGQSAVGMGSQLTGKSGFAGTFFSGVLATVVATPCAAPFLAPALGAALTLPAAASFLVFSLIALGLSTPYLLLCAFPGLINRMPRPGPWMETFKQVMAFLLYATVAYLLWVLAGQLADESRYPSFSLLKVLFSLVILAFALWVFGRWGAYHRPRPVRLSGGAACLLLTGLALATGLSGTRAQAIDGSVLEWQKWEPRKAEQLAAEGKTVYVDFTARWCVTCQTNKAAVFSSQKVRDALREQETILMKADWTHRDPEISQALEAFGRSAVPFNLIYGPSREKPVVLPEILTPGIVLEALESVSGT